MSKRTLGDIKHLFANDDFKRYPRGTFDDIFITACDLFYAVYKEGIVPGSNSTECPLLYNLEFPDTRANRLLQVALQGISVGYTAIHCTYLVQSEFMRMMKFDADITEKELEEISIMFISAAAFINFYYGEHNSFYAVQYESFACQMCSHDANPKIEKVIAYMKEKGAPGKVCTD